MLVSTLLTLLTLRNPKHNVIVSSFFFLFDIISFSSPPFCSIVAATYQNITRDTKWFLVLTCSSLRSENSQAIYFMQVGYKPKIMQNGKEMGNSTWSCTLAGQPDSFYGNMGIPLILLLIIILF